jgi:RNA polymerase sigma-70 factor (ECF subfamily)
MIMGDLEELYLSMRHGLRRVVSRIVPPDEVEDIVQETYIRLRRAVVAQEIRHPRSYLYRMARNLALDSIKKADNALGVEWNDDANYAADISDSVINKIESTANFERFCESVEHLPAQARKVFVLKKVYGFTQREIASELGISESTVEKHVALGSRRCSRYMGDVEFSGPPAWAGVANRSCAATT